MIRAAVPESASGLRPASAYFVVAAVLVVVALWVGGLSLAAGDSVSFEPQREQDPQPEYTIVDRAERPLAEFTSRLDVVVSPRALWQAHTPEVMARRMALALGGRTRASELLARMLPDARAGVIEARFQLDEQQARALDFYARRGSLDAKQPELPISGMWVERSRSGGYVLCWQPQVVLGTEVRAAHLPRQDKNPLRWSRELADGIARCLLGDAAVAPGGDEQELEEQRAAIWRGLMPSRYCVALPDFDATCAPDLWRMLNEERVAPHQMSIQRGRNRIHPLGKLGVLGSWGYASRAEGEIRALEEWGFEKSELVDVKKRAALVQSFAPEARAELARRTWAHLSDRSPVSGMEHLCDALLAQPQWSFLDRTPASFTFNRHNPARQPSRSYYLDSQPASETPRVVSTLDAGLQLVLARELDLLLERNRPAVAMAIVVDVETGDVLAVDARSPFQLGGFAPVSHQFTPGSTAKVLVMACAVEAGKVNLAERINVGHGEWRLKENGRVIHEAEHSKEGWLTPAECLAHSLNAGMAQIGLRVPAAEMHARYAAMHYGERPPVGVGTERPGYLPKLPWSYKSTHTSMCFGHEWMATLWQHAAGLATVIRGGEWRPLRLVSAVEQNGQRWNLPLADPEPVFKRATCDIVRDMMMLGARVGTGAPVASPKLLPGLIVGSKTGTAEKVPTEICLHEELADQERHHKHGTRCSKACRRALVGRRAGHRSCYTASMCVFGRREEGGREIMVLVVADEPRSAKHYGSQVAGPTAVAILKEALGTTALGEPVVAATVNGFVLSALESRDGAAEPWAEDFR